MGPYEIEVSPNLTKPSLAYNVLWLILVRGFHKPNSLFKDHFRLEMNGFEKSCFKLSMMEPNDAIKGSGSNPQKGHIKNCYPLRPEMSRCVEIRGLFGSFLSFK